ncbi:MAG: biotin--[acetyl-CoA-carboxylase] ligase [Clostridia bacterium]|nr:biotin--[acetyl-CoA-carboxylase] ligase [Clostridia bacterium]
MKIIKFEKIDSTNNYLKGLKKPKEDVVAIADEQTGGRGSKGRSFSSLRGGVYLSALKLNPCKAADSFTIMENAALAVCRTLSAFGIEGGIKWPNDVFVNGKKICGILIENVFGGDMVTRSVTGIGLNVNNPLPAELKEIATTMKEVAGKEFSVQTVRATLVYNLFLTPSAEEYKRRSLVLGKEIKIIKPDGTEYFGVAEDVLPNGNLLLKGGEVLSSAEVSIVI